MSKAKLLARLAPKSRSCFTVIVCDPHTMTVKGNQTTLHAVPFKVKEVGAAFVPFQVPLKPGGEDSDCPGEMEALYETLVIVTVLPLWVKFPFHSCEMVCPLGKENCKLQPLMAVEPVLLMVRLAPKPPDHWLVIA